MQNGLDRLYCRLLSAGFISLRKAAEAQDIKWLNSELEFLHEIPTLIGDTTRGRHEYFWRGTRTHYMEEVAASTNERQKSNLRTYYEPIWEAMESLITPKTL
jgi:hypothetical protein